MIIEDFNYYIVSDEELKRLEEWLIKNEEWLGNNRDKNSDFSNEKSE
jgi:hypothetical protein